MWNNKVSGEPREGVATWSNNQGVAMPRSNNTHRNKTKRTKKKKTHKLQIETTNLTKQRKNNITQLRRIKISFNKRRNKSA